MKKRLLALSRIVALVGTTVVLAALLGCARVALIGRPRRAGLLTDRYVGLWARAARRIIGMRVFVDGDEPTSPVALVCNHLSYVDIIALWSIHPGVFVARADVASWPLIGQVGRLIGTIFIDRDRKRDLLRVIPEMEVHLAEGRSVIFFPEGTSSCGARVLPFRSSLFEAAARGGVSVVGASLQLKTPRTSPSADLSVCWWGDMAFPPHVFALLHIDGIDACVRFANTSHLGSDRKLLCRLAKDSVEKSFSPTSPGAHDEPSSITAPTRQGREQLS